MPLRRIVFWLHLIVAVPTAAVILMMSVTGVALTFERQMIEWADREHRVEVTSAQTQAPISALVRSAVAWEPQATPTSIVLSSDPSVAAAMTIARGRTLYLDPATAKARGENHTRMRTFMSSMRSWHRWLAVSGDGRGIARAITGWSNVVFLFLVLSGLYLWFPRRWTLRHFRSVTLLRLKARGKARDFNWHHVFGFWMSMPLAVVVASATVISFPWARDLAYRVVGDTPPAPRAAPTQTAAGDEPELPRPEPIPFDVQKVDPLVAVASRKVDDWRTITISVPAEAGDPVVFRIASGLGGQPQRRGTLTLDSETRGELGWETFDDLSAGARARSFLRFAHTGEFWGVWGQALAGLASLAGVILVWTGIALAWRRMVRAIRRRSALGREGMPEGVRKRAPGALDEGELPRTLLPHPPETVYVPERSAQPHNELTGRRS